MPIVRIDRAVCKMRQRLSIGLEGDAKNWLSPKRARAFVRVFEKPIGLDDGDASWVLGLRFWFGLHWGWFPVIP
jgi:hypothetical protein